jgi:hypothetical protein
MPILDPVFREQLRRERQPKVLLGGEKRERDSATRLRENELTEPPSREVMKVEEQPEEILQAGTSSDSLRGKSERANALVVRQVECKPAAWWPRFIGPSTREVSREDALDCVRWF